MDSLDAICTEEMPEPVLGTGPVLHMVKKMGKLTEIVLQAGWDRSLRQEGVKWGHLLSSLHLACVWDVYSQDTMGRYSGS